MKRMIAQWDDSKPNEYEQKMEAKKEQLRVKIEEMLNLEICFKVYMRNLAYLSGSMEETGYGGPTGHVDQDQKDEDGQAEAVPTEVGIEADPRQPLQVALDKLFTSTLITILSLQAHGIR